MEIGKDHLCFLDLKISVSSNKLMATVYSKLTDSHLYLHSTCHKSSSINGIPKGVGLCLSRICSTTQEYQKQKNIHLIQLQEDIIPKLQNQHLIKFKKYHVLLRERKNNRSIRTSSVIFLAKFNPCGPNVSKIINKHRHL